MKGDFSRKTFRPQRHYSGVLMQQGRVQVDADWNEQVDIFLNQLRTATADIIGWHGTPQGPCEPGGFAIELVDGELRIGPGHYYVDGILCENDTLCTYATQPSAPCPERRLPDAVRHLVFLDVWERHITCLEDPDLLEVALGGPDTTTRRQIVWQVRIRPIRRRAAAPDDQESLRRALGLRRKGNAGSLRVRVTATAGPEEEHLASGYLGLENRLYRVEIHDGGTGRFKWSQDNGSLACSIASCTGTELTVTARGREGLESLDENDWLEIEDDHTALSQRGGDLVQVLEADVGAGRIVVDSPVSVALDRHPLLRRWDGCGTASSGWTDLNAGIQVSFDGGQYRPGDYWLIPARPAVGDIEWPYDEGTPKSIPPLGVHHHYTPLALLADKVTDLRRFFTPLAG